MEASVDDPASIWFNDEDDRWLPRRADQEYLEICRRREVSELSSQPACLIVAHELILRPYKHTLDRWERTSIDMDRKRWSYLGRTQNACAADDEGNMILHAAFQLLMLGLHTVPACWHDVTKFIRKPACTKNDREYCGDVIEAMLGVTEIQVAEALEFQTHLYGCLLYTSDAADE